MDSVRLSVWRLSPNAVQNMTGQEVYPRVDTTETSLETYEFNRLRDTRLSQVWSGTLETKGARNGSVVTAFPIAKLVEGQKPGLYLVTAENARTPRSESRIATSEDKPTDSSDGYDSDYGSAIAAHWVNVSDTALTTMRGADGLHVFARAFSTALPLKGVTIRLVSQGGDDLGRAVSDNEGQVVFPVALTRGKGVNQPVSLIATSPNGDFSTVSLTQAWFDFSDRGAEGHPAPGPQQTVIVTDRGIYRPGETVNATFLLRNPQGKALDTLPLTVILRRPDGVKAQTLTLKPQEGEDSSTVLPFRQALPKEAGPWRPMSTRLCLLLVVRLFWCRISCRRLSPLILNRPKRF